MNRMRMVGRALAVALRLGALGAGATASEAGRRGGRVEEVMRVKSYPARSWDDAFTFESDSYRVRTNTSQDVAHYIGQLMDYAQKNYKEIFSYDDAVEKMDIYAYRTYQEFATIGKAMPGSAGFFRYRGDVSEIHVAYIDKWGKTYPTQILLHEGTHQFVHQAIDFAVPAAYKDKIPDMSRLPSVPLWLNEGMATYIENAYYDGRRLVVGEVNVNRLRGLQALIKRGQVIPMEKLFQVEGGEAFMAMHCYEPAWGLVYWFLHDKRSSVQKKKRKLLSELVDACKRGFMETPEKDFERLFLTGPNWQQQFWPKWRQHIREQSIAKLRELTVKDNPFDKWEQVWHAWILDLNPHKPYGGLAD